MSKEATDDGLPGALASLDVSPVLDRLLSRDGETSSLLSNLGWQDLRIAV